MEELLRNLNGRGHLTDDLVIALESHLPPAIDVGSGFIPAEGLVLEDHPVSCPCARCDDLYAETFGKRPFEVYRCHKFTAR